LNEFMSLFVAISCLSLERGIEWFSLSSDKLLTRYLSSETLHYYMFCKSGYICLA
jgi:hypothetical protein